MCIYCGTSNYRKIYINHHGLIPKDEDNRSFDIHHIDSNHKNNEPNNLIAISIKEHYNIHYNKGEYGAALMIKARMKATPEELSRLGSLEQQKRVKNKTHNMLGGQIQRKRVERKTHNFLGSKHNYNQLKNGTHVTQNYESMKIISEKARTREKEKVEKGLHYWKSEDYKIFCRERNLKLVNEGRHPSQQKSACPYCNKLYAKNHLTRYHGEKCKEKS
jgi:hypothetical protein